MRLISRSPYSHRAFSWFIVSLLSGCAVWMASALGKPSTKELWVIAFLVVLMWWPFFFGGRGYLADEVQDAGDELIVRKSGSEVRIPLAEIVNVDTRQDPMDPLHRVDCAVLTLREPCTLGREVRFFPVDAPRFLSLRPVFSSRLTPVIMELIQRIDQARRRH
jgi:hypothetical protein